MDWQQIYENLYYTIKQPETAVFVTEREIEKANTSIMYNIITSRKPSKNFWRRMEDEGNLVIPTLQN